MHVTLLRPPVYSIGMMGAQKVPVLGPAYIASYLRSMGFTVDFIDMCAEGFDRALPLKTGHIEYGMSFENLIKRIRFHEIFAITCMFSQDWVFHKELIKKLKHKFPESFIIAGGEHITAIPEYCLKDLPELDVCVLGEGEIVFTELLNKHIQKRSLETVPGIAFRLNDGNIKVNKKAERIKDIDLIPEPAWDLIPIERYLKAESNYHLKRGRTLPILATRGCPYHCTFCSNPNMWGSPWLTRNIIKVVDEMQNYIQNYNIKNFVFSDLTMVVKKNHIVSFCMEILKRKLEITWQVPTLRTESLDKETLELMYNAGCRELDFAIETANCDVLKKVNKGNDPKKMFHLINIALKTRMTLTVNIVLGLPDDGYKGFLKTYFLAMKLAIMGMQELNVFPFVPYPGSKLFYDFLKSQKIKLNDEFFLGLFGYANLTKAVSWSNLLSPRMLCFLRWILISNFYTLMFITHPTRVFKMLTNVITGRSSSKFEAVLARIIQSFAIYYRKPKDKDKLRDEN